MTAIIERIPGGGRAREIAAWVVALVGLLLVTQVVLPGPGGGTGRGTPAAILFVGLVVGAGNALVAAGIVLVYRFSRVINFAQTALGVAAASWVVLFVRYDHSVPFPVVFLTGIALSGLVGVTVDLLFGRRFANAPRLVLTVVTIAVAGGVGIQAFSLVSKLPFFPPMRERAGINGLNDLQYPQIHPRLPMAGWSFHVGHGGQPFGFTEVFTLEIALVALVALGLFLRYSRTGVAIRSASENSERAALLGISVGALGTLVWLIAGVLAGISATTSVMRGDLTSFGFSPPLLLTPLAAAVLGRMSSIAKAVIAAVGLSVLYQAFTWSFRRTFGLFFVLELAVLLVALAVQRRGAFRTSSVAETTWQASEEIRPIPKELLVVAGVRIARIVGVLLIVGAIGLIPFLTSTRIINLFSAVFLVGIVAVSLVVLTGWTGQVSLGHLAFSAIGAFTAGWLTASHGVPFWVSVPIGTVLAAAAAFLVGLPALRIRGLFLGVATFAFAVAVDALMVNDRLLGKSMPRTIARPSLLFLNFEDEKSMYFLCLVALAIVVVIVGNLRRSRLGRILIGLRENEANLQSFGIRVTRMKLLAFTLSGALAGFAGAVFAFQQRSVVPQTFGPIQSFGLFVSVVVGGVSSIPGGLLGVTYLQAFNIFFGRNYFVGLLVSLGPLLVLFLTPGGLMGLLIGLRDGALRIVAQRRQLVVPSLFADYDAEALEHKLIPLGEPDLQSGLASLPADQRFALASELYKGRGQRVIEKLAGPQQTREGAALQAASATAEERTVEVHVSAAATATAVLEEAPE